MSTPRVAFPDVAAAAISYLRDRFVALGETAEVHEKVPAPRPEKFVTIVRGGGTRSSIIEDTALLLVEAWAPSTAAAHDLAQLARTEIHTMRGQVVDTVAVGRIDEVGGPEQLPDAVTDTPRYVFTLEIRARGT